MDMSFFIIALSTHRSLSLITIFILAWWAFPPAITINLGVESKVNKKAKIIYFGFLLFINI
ncbi:hypothetical protein C9J12_00235 [Photobacterium frigidiphilum]|uniref:Uncharacterized protein n=1 Tax=Photobacterium frigidiphilum TaxID=264736 RepID=A0A2T3JQQ3_9GAMM|nr:hypothetical protein C9J12_00235 [Photobacterium frigidiphilum]